MSLNIGVEPIHPPDSDNDDGANDIWSQIEDIEAAKQEVVQAGGIVTNVSVESANLAIEFIVPDEFDLALGVGRAAKVGKFAYKFTGLAKGVGSKVVSAWRGRRAARGKSAIVAAEGIAKVTRKGRVGTKPSNLPYDEADEAADATSEVRPVTGGGGCFVAGTLVLMGDGTFKPIEQVKQNDIVLSRDEKTGNIEARRVAQTLERQKLSTLVLTFSNKEKIETTDEHPFYVEHKGFVPAGLLAVGNSIVTRAGPSLRVLDVQHKGAAATVYNFVVEDFHTYFVGNSKLWVHNDCTPLPAGQKMPESGRVIKKPVDQQRWPGDDKYTDFDEIRQVGDGRYILVEEKLLPGTNQHPEAFAEKLYQQIAKNYMDALRYGTNLPDYLRDWQNMLKTGQLQFGTVIVAPKQIGGEPAQAAFRAAVEKEMEDLRKKLIKEFEVPEQTTVYIEIYWV